MKTKKNISVCGIDCKEYFACNKCSSICKNMHAIFDSKKPCEGCNAIHEKILLNRNISLNICPIYVCVTNRQYKHCGECEQIPCDIYYELKDPFITDSVHKLNIEERIKVLKSIKD